MTTTDALIHDLAASAAPVRRLARPELRAVAWLAFAAAVIVVVLAIHGIDPDAARGLLSDPRMLGETVATAVTAISAALAAFRSTIPGASQRWLFVPFAALAVWVALTGSGCAADYARLGAGALALRLDTACFVPGAIIGAVLTVALVAMLRRGVPLVPRLTLLLGGMAVAATVNLGLLVFHEGDVSVMLLVWHTGFVLALAALGGWLGPRLFGWRTLPRPT